MKEKKLFIEIKEEYEEIRVRRRGTAAVHGRECPECKEQVRWLTISETVAELEIDPDVFSNLLAGVDLHFTTRPGGGILVCGRAVIHLIGKRQMLGPRQRT